MSGWKFSVTVPTWTATQLGDDPVVVSAASRQGRKEEVWVRRLPKETHNSVDGANTTPTPSQFYRVEVRVVPPDAPPRVRGVLRRYSHFVRLFEKVCVRID
jgi:hypothetical protein